MTREDFIELRLQHISKQTKATMPAEFLQEITADEIDFYVAAGMLKLDEPKSAEERFIELSIHQGRGEGFATNVLQILDLAGLRIVEK